MSNFGRIVELLSECKLEELEFQCNDLLKVKNVVTGDERDKSQFINYLKTNQIYFQNEVISAYLKQKSLENLEENLSKLEIDADFLFNFTSNWISRLPDEIRSTKCVNQLLLPGTHNTCTTRILWSHRPIFMNRIVYYSSKLPYVRARVENLVVNQTKTIVEQVQAGVRLFDLRIAKDAANRLLIAHTFYVCELEQCLNELKYCLNSYSNEIFVVNIKIDFPYQAYFNTSDLNSVHRMFGETLGEYILPSSRQLDTIKNTIASGKRLVVYFNMNKQLLQENQEFLNKINTLFRVQQSHEMWPNEESLEKVMHKLNKCLNDMSYREKEFVYLSFNITPKVNLRSLNHSICETKAEEVRYKENKFREFLQNACLKYISGVILDNPTFSLIQEVIAFNFK